MRGVALAVVAASLLGLGSARAEEEAARFFKQNCASCHTIGGGRLTGPDLKDVGKRRDPTWLKRFIADPKAMIDAGDPVAQQLLQEYRGIVMPTVVGMSAAQADAMVRLIEAESALPVSVFSGTTSSIPDRPFTAAEIQEGRRLFTGERRLKNGGPSCISCHAAPGLGLLGGGRLGPDLAGAFVKLDGRKGLAGWLGAPATPTMQPIFRAQPLEAAAPPGGGLDEVALLVAYLESVGKQGPAVKASVDQLHFVLIGLFGAAVCLVAFDVVWGGRFRAVRRPLIRDSKERGAS